MFVKAKHLFTQQVIPHDVRALNNELNITLTIVYFLISTQYQWILGDYSPLKLRLDNFLFWSQSLQAIYYLVTPTSIDMDSVYVGGNLDVSQRINQ